MPEVPVPNMVPESQSGSLLFSIGNPASFQASIPAMTPYKIPVELKFRNSRGVKYSSFINSEISGVPDI